eukprot:12830548-Alexandrium_andersonii.AAC.1
MFEKCRGELLFTFTLKLSSFLEPPSLLFGAAHHNPLIARDALSKCLASSSTHPRVVALQREPLASEARAYLQGT